MTLPSNYFLYATDLINTVLLGSGMHRRKAVTQALDLQANTAPQLLGFAVARRSTAGPISMVREWCAAIGQRICQIAASQGALPFLALTRARVSTQAE